MHRQTWLYDGLHGLRFILRAYWRMELVGAVDSIPNTGPLLIVSNHSSFIDPWVLGAVIPHKIRYLITDDWYYRSRFWQWFFSSFATEPTRGGDPRETIKAVCRILERGEVTGIFPEGRISYDGKLQRFRPGLARMAAISGAQVVPAAILGSFRSLPRARYFPRPTKIRVVVGEPVVFPGAPHEQIPDRELRAEFTDLIYAKIQALLDQEEGL